MEFTTASAEESRRLGTRLGVLLRRGDIVALIGDLGAGKTTLTQGIGRGLGLKTYLRSPTFTMVNEYRLADETILLHVDGYRLSETMAEAMLEADTFGMSQLLADDDSIVVIEWADRVMELLPADRLEIRIAYANQEEEMRHWSMLARGERGRALLRQLQALGFER